MSSTEVTKLPQLAREIQAEHEAAERDFQSAVGHAIRAGELLIEAKAQIVHGGWLPWLEANFEFSERHARRFKAANWRFGRCQDVPQRVPLPSLLRTEAEALRVEAIRIERAADDLPQACDALARTEGILGSAMPLLRAGLARAHAQGCHTALGHASWEAYVDAELPMPAEWDDEFRATMRLLLVEPLHSGDEAA